MPSRSTFARAGRLGGWFFAASLSIAGSLVSADETCKDLTAETPDSLLHYRFKKPSRPILDQLERDRRYRIGEIRIVRQPIFDVDDPRERNRLFQTADWLHVRTRESVIRKVILFKEDDAVTPRTLAESERRLREKAFLYDARVLPRRLCADHLDVDVVTRDVWTLTPELDYGRAGGSDKFGLGLSEANLLGYGQDVELGYRSDEDRSGYNASYAVANLGDSQIGLYAYAASNSDGFAQVLDVGQRFYSFDAPFALGGRIERFDQDEALYFRGDDVSRFEHQLRGFRLSGGVRGAYFDRGVWRWTGGYQYEDDAFSPTSRGTPPVPFPEDRTLSYPFVGFEFVQDRYAIATNVDRIEQTEDVYVGRHYSGQVGYSSHALGGDDEARAAYRLDYGNALSRNPSHLVLYNLAARGYWNFDRSRDEDATLEADLLLHRRQSDLFSLASSATFVYGHNLFVDHQLLLGGDTGLKGYPSRYQAGDRLFLVSIEERYRSRIYLWHLFRIGFAVFVDVGRAWYGGDPSQADYGVLADAGLGLRVESTRTRRDQIFHLDFGVPLVDGPNLDAVQISFTVKTLL